MQATLTKPAIPATRSTTVRPPIAVAGIIVAAAAVYSTYALIRFRDFRSSTYDLLIFDRIVHSYSRFHLPTAIAKGVHDNFGPHFITLGDHFSPILASLAPLYWLHDGPRTLLIAQSVLLALGIIPLWRYAHRRLGAGGAYCVVGIYALSWPVAEIVAFDFHEMAFTPVLSLLALERHDAGRRRQCAAAAGALLLVKEDMGLLVAGIGLYLLTRGGHRRQGLLFVAGGIGWTFLAVDVLIPAFGGSPHYYWAYDALGPDLPHAALHALTRPGDALRLFVTPGIKVFTMACLVVPLLLLPLASPITLAILPLLAERMLANEFKHWWEPQFHYNAALIGLLVAAGVDSATRLRRLRLSTAWPVAAFTLSLIALPFFAFKAFFLPAFYERGPHEQAAADVISKIPQGVYVEAANQIGPRLPDRAHVLLWDATPRWAPWVVADVVEATFPFPDVQSQLADVQLLITSGYSVVAQDDGWVVLHKPGSVAQLENPCAGRPDRWSTPVKPWHPLREVTIHTLPSACAGAPTMKAR